MPKSRKKRNVNTLFKIKYGKTRNLGNSSLNITRRSRRKGARKVLRQMRTIRRATRRSRVYAWVDRNIILSQRLVGIATGICDI